MSARCFSSTSGFRHPPVPVVAPNPCATCALRGVPALQLPTCSPGEGHLRTTTDTLPQDWSRQRKSGHTPPWTRVRPSLQFTLRNGIEGQRVCYSYLRNARAPLCESSCRAVQVDLALLHFNTALQSTWRQGPPPAQRLQFTEGSGDGEHFFTVFPN